jgi:lambda repressor-like predicted transcriptional regulator
VIGPQIVLKRVFPPASSTVQLYGDVLREYEFHPESKCADADGDPCTKQTLGPLRRRHIWIEQVKYIGKESNSLEEVESGLIHSAQSVYTEYPDSRRDDWQTRILPALRKISLKELASKSGISRSALKEIRAGRSRPHHRNRAILAELLQLGLI